MARCMGEISLRDCFNYLDETIFFSSGFGEHLEKLEAVFKCLQECNLKRKCSKCDFLKAGSPTLDTLFLNCLSIYTDSNKK